jgi:hypothetical protein
VTAHAQFTALASLKVDVRMALAEWLFANLKVVMARLSNTA